MNNFDTLGLSKPILRAVVSAGYTAPTPIQAAAIPALIARKDMVGIAQTGTGKTAAFVLPMLERILAKHNRPKANHCDVVILAPTRELAAQIHDNIRLYGKYLDVTSCVIVGGVKPYKQLKALARGVNIMVATPGRMEDHIATGAIILAETTAVVLDEADQMFDMGFIPAIRRIMHKLPRSRQTVMFSATMPKPIRALANDFLTHPVEVSVAPASRPIERIEQKMLAVSKAEKRAALQQILSQPDIEKAIVFTRTKHGANKVSDFLDKVGIRSDAIHGNKSQNQRQRTLNDFKAGELTVLVATDIAARGIDIDNVSHVINFELPNVPEAYVHRIGRTARAGTTGIAITLCDPEEYGLLRDIEKLIGYPLAGNRDALEKAASFQDNEKETIQPSRGRRHGANRGNAKGGNRANNSRHGKAATGDDNRDNKKSHAVTANGDRRAATREGETHQRTHQKPANSRRRADQPNDSERGKSGNASQHSQKAGKGHQNRNRKPANDRGGLRRSA